MLQQLQAAQVWLFSNVGYEEISLTLTVRVICLHVCVPCVASAHNAKWEEGKRKSVADAVH